MTLSTREKKLIVIAVGAVLAVLGYHFSIRPTIERNRSLTRRIIPDKQETLSEVSSLAEEYVRLEREIEQLSEEVPRPEAGFSPLGFIEQAVNESGIDGWSLDSTREVQGERITQVTMDIRITETGWEELINFFRYLEQAETALQLNSIDMRRQRTRRGTQQGLTVNLTVTGIRRSD